MHAVRILVIGGTQFVGRHIVEAALERGHDVTLFHRGVTGDDLFPEATHVHGDRNEDLDALSRGEWDVTVDACAYFPRQVRALAGALTDRGGHYVFISTISAYADPPGPGLTEDAPLRELQDPDTEVLDGDTYGGLKALCETAARESFGDIAIVRPTYVVGPHDHTRRFTWWVWRFARGGDILAPGPADDPLQVIDARDLARFVIDIGERRRAGTWHTMSPQPPFSIADMFDAIARAVAPPGHRVEWVDDDFLVRSGVGEGDFPLWGARDPQRFVLAADASRALAEGLSPRPLAETIRDTLEWAQTSPPEGAGLSPRREAELLETWRRR
jgi:2'-hydroxyisoflavone reductase